MFKGYYPDRGAMSIGRTRAAPRRARMESVGRGDGLPGILDLIGVWLERCRQRADLARLDDRLLKDIGLSRTEADREARKWFWQP